MNNGPEDKDKEKKAGKEGHHHSHRRKDKQAVSKRDKKHHHRHHHGVEKSSTPSKPTGIAPKPPLDERIVTEMHADNAPVTTMQPTLKAISPKLVPTEAPKNNAPIAPGTLKQTISTELGFFAKVVEWLKNKLLKPTVLRQQQIASAYSLQFLTTLNAIQSQFSANDETPEKLASNKSLQFSTKAEKSTAAETVAVLDNSVNPKPTIH